MKRLVILAVAFLSVFLSIPAKADFISAKAAVLISSDTGEVLYSRNCDQRLPMASTTKIMTALVVLEKGGLDRIVTVTGEMIRVEGTSMGLSSGDTLTVRDLLYGMMLVSGNDAANALAVSVGGSYDRFIALMNKKARELGLCNTRFETPSGLDGERHYTSAYDLAMITKAAFLYEDFRKIVSTESIILSYGDPPCKRQLINHNKLLKMYDDVAGVKTGFTKKSGRCLVSAAQKDGKSLIAVTLNDPDDWEDHRKLLDLGFSTLKKQSLSGFDISIPVVGGNVRLNETVAQKDICLSKEKEVTRTIIAPAFLYSPVKKGDTVGYADYCIGDALIEREMIVSGRDIEYKKDPFGVFSLIFLTVLRCINEG
ncbi:MAG: D-alanyl-D-alanine carboxypeptidase [Clostridia bacterium]|nr:D-alanyl-D-alanine carboxypeptidase [Clostridia bacterium]